MNNFNLPSSMPISSDLDNEEVSLKSFNFNNYNPTSQYIIENNYELNFCNTSNLNFYDTNDISQGILTKNENITEVYKNVFRQNFYVENDKKENQAFTSLYKIEKNNNNNLKDYNTNNVNNSNIIIEIKNTNFNYEDKIENQNIVFNIFNSGDYDIYSNYMIDEVLNNSNKKCIKIKTIKKLFTQFPKKRRKKKKNIEHRKDNADNIRKKIKVKFHKILKNSINEKLKNAGSKYIFKALPQSFITNITKKINRPILDLPLEEIFKKFIGKEKNNRKNNLSVLEYLENHNDISEKANFNEIKNMKYEEIFNEYLLSKEFKKVISTLKKDNENDKYIKDYIVKAYGLINFIKQD